MSFPTQRSHVAASGTAAFAAHPVAIDEKGDVIPESDLPDFVQKGVPDPTRDCELLLSSYRRWFSEERDTRVGKNYRFADEEFGFIATFRISAGVHKTRSSHLIRWVNGRVWTLWDSMARIENKAHPRCQFKLCTSALASCKSLVSNPSVNQL